MRFTLSGPTPSIAVPYFDFCGRFILTSYDKGSTEGGRVRRSGGPGGIRRQSGTAARGIGAGRRRWFDSEYSLTTTPVADDEAMVVRNSRMRNDDFNTPARRRDSR